MTQASIDLHHMLVSQDRRPTHVLRGVYGMLDAAEDIFVLLASSNQSRVEPDADDALAIFASLEGDSEAFGRIVEKYQATIAQQMTRFARDPAVIEELVHDVFVEAFLSLRSFRGTAPLVRWLRKVAVRVGYRYWKRRERDRARALPSSEVLAQLVAGPVPAGDEASLWLHELLDCLAPRDRVVLTLQYWEGYTVAETSALLGWSKTMVKVQVYRARNRLRRLIEEASQ